MKLIKPQPAMSQPLLWRQAISQSKFGVLNWKNFYYYPLTKWLFSFRIHESSLFDYTFIGSNPILTHILLIQLANKARCMQKKIKVGLYFTGNDYWSYHLFETEAPWQFINDEMGFKIGNDFSDFCEQYKDFLKHLDISIIYSENNSISYYQKDEQYSKGYVVHLKPNEYKTNSFEKAMPHVNVAENTIRLQYVEQYLKWLSTKDNVKKLKYSDKMQKNQDSEEKTHLLLSEHIYLTSLPYWVNCHTEQRQVTNYEQHTYSSTEFIHAFNNFSCGTANHTANDFHSLEHQSLEDIIQLLKNPII